jgi:hypothetical protein
LQQQASRIKTELKGWNIYSIESIDSQAIYVINIATFEIGSSFRILCSVKICDVCWCKPKEQLEKVKSTEADILSGSLRHVPRVYPLFPSDLWQDVSNLA